MKLLKNFKKHNAAQSKISITLKEKLSYQGDKVVLEVITQNQPPNGITIELQEFWHEKENRNGILTNIEQVRSEATFSQNECELFPGNGFIFSLTLQLPKNCRTSTRASGWRIIATAEEQTTTRVLEVMPAYEFMTIISVCERRMRFKEKITARHWSENGYVYFRMIPPNILKPELDSLTLAFSHTETNMITVGMTIKLKEKTPEDYFQNMIKPINILNKSFQIDPNHIFLEDGNPNIPNITNSIIPLLQQSIAKENLTD